VLIGFGRFSDAGCVCFWLLSVRMRACGHLCMFRLLLCEKAGEGSFAGGLPLLRMVPYD
jgi:hypothetical protein